VGALLGVDRSTVTKWFTKVNDHNGKSPPPDARVKLTTPAKEEIVRRIEAGQKQEQIASDYGVCPATVTKVKQAAERSEQKAAAVRVYRAILPDALGHRGHRCNNSSPRPGVREMPHMAIGR
jgi:transposase-like protein